MWLFPNRRNGDGDKARSDPVDAANQGPCGLRPVGNGRRRFDPPGLPQAGLLLTDNLRTSVSRPYSWQAEATAF